MTLCTHGRIPQRSNTVSRHVQRLSETSQISDVDFFSVVGPSDTWERKPTGQAQMHSAVRCTGPVVGADRRLPKRGHEDMADSKILHVDAVLRTSEVHRVHWLQ